MKDHERRGTKVCAACGKEKPATDFSPQRRKRKGVVRVYLASACKVCQRERSKSSRAKNPELYLAKARAWKANNAERNRQITQEWREQNRDHIHEYNKEKYSEDPESRRAAAKAYRRKNPQKILSAVKSWQQDNPEKAKAIKRKASAKRRTAKKTALVDWADSKKMQAFYDEAVRLTAETGIQHDVDHIVPLLGKHVSGLHWEGNLQVIPSVDNRRKSNTFVQDMI